jgi:two-component system OmpR family sensor kinase
MKKDLEHFISINQKSKFIQNGIIPKYNGLKLVIFVNSNKVVGNFNIDKNFNFGAEYNIIKNKLYYIHKEHRVWGKVYAVTFTNIKKDIELLKKQILLFFILSAIFIIMISFVLGKIFLKPMKNTIESLENFIADSTHEINTPLSNILINIELIKELYPNIDTIEEFEKIKTSTFRISQIFKDLTFVQFNHKQQKQIQTICIKETILKRLEFFNTLIKNKKLHLNYDLHSKKIDIDSEDLIRLVDNLNQMLLNTLLLMEILKLFLLTNY